MVEKYKVITLCGSTRFKDSFMEAPDAGGEYSNQCRPLWPFRRQRSLGKHGRGNADAGTLTRTKEMLDDMHKRKIDMSDEIYVINVGGYIGTSTQLEIDYAIATGKAVRYLEEVE